ncbi:MAG: histidinol-phosphatase [Nitrospira sp.]|nr:histidinol-phosphatase [Nitrospira sp.]
MTAHNKALAQIFVSMADKLATQQANPHRVRAYRRAAESLVELEEDVSLVAERGALQEIPGIGKDLSAKIQEFLKTGKIQAYEEMKSPLPREVASWSTLPGLSDNVIHHLYNRLGIKTLDDLESLVRSHLLRTLPGVTASEEELLAAIQTRRQAAP